VDFSFASKSSAEAMADKGDRSLLDYFNEGRHIYLAVEKSGAEAAEVGRAIQSLETALSLIQALQLFSANEEIDDIKTSSLKYVRFHGNFNKQIKSSSLLLPLAVATAAMLTMWSRYLLGPFYLGSLYGQVQTRESRLENLIRARVYLTNFFENCAALGLVHPQVRARPILQSSPSRNYHLHFFP